MKKFVLFYESPDDVLERARLHFPAHREHWESYLADGSLLMIGPFADRREGAMSVFSTREAAERFAESDPFVLNGVVSNWYIREWDEAIANP